MGNNIVSNTATTPSIWWTCPGWCTVGHANGDDGVLRTGEPVVTHGKVLVDTEFLNILLNREDVLTADGIEVGSDGYNMSALRGDYTPITPEQAKILAVELGTFAQNA
jgi:hypothetical protein